MDPSFYLYHLIASGSIAAGTFFLFRRRESPSVIRILVVGVFLLFGLALAALVFPVEGFARVRLLAWEAFFYFPVTLLLGIRYFWKDKRPLAVGLGLLCLVIALIAIDSFLIEPNWLKTTRIEITSSKIEEPLVVALLADIQTDQPGNYEREVLRVVTDNQPDLILLAGDYIQVPDQDSYQSESRVLNQILLEGDLSADLGIYAVRGNVDWNSWGEIFQGLEITIFEETESLDLGPIQLTGIGWLDSANPSLQLDGVEKFHIFLGHSPNYSLGEIEGDLLLAGHTHGGQVQLPGIGPLLTLSAVPRQWASGLTEIEPGKYLLVSNGIGLERGGAPHLRFLCRPEVIFISLKPAD